jgi:excisionase family DNA binding protein
MGISLGIVRIVRLTLSQHKTKNMDKLVIISRDELKELISEAVSKAFDEVNKDTFTDRDLMTRVEAAEFLNASLVSIRAWSKKGLIKPYTIGGRVFFKRSEVEASLKTKK